MRSNNMGRQRQNSAFGKEIRGLQQPPAHQLLWGRVDLASFLPCFLPTWRTGGGEGPLTQSLATSTIKASFCQVLALSLSHASQFCLIGGEISTQLTPLPPDGERLTSPKFKSRNAVKPASVNEMYCPQLWEEQPSRLWALQSSRTRELCSNRFWSALSPGACLQNLTTALLQDLTQSTETILLYTQPKSCVSGMQRFLEMQWRKRAHSVCFSQEKPNRTHGGLVWTFRPQLLPLDLPGNTLTILDWGLDSSLLPQLALNQPCNSAVTQTNLILHLLWRIDWKSEEKSPWWLIYVPFSTLCVAEGLPEGPA